jgi:hypothetical protein
MQHSCMLFGLDAGLILVLTWHGFGWLKAKMSAFSNRGLAVGASASLEAFLHVFLMLSMACTLLACVGIQIVHACWITPKWVGCACPCLRGKGVHLPGEWKGKAPARSV